MKKLILTFSFLVLLLGTLQASVSIIPMPQKCIEKRGNFTVNDKTVITLSVDNEEMRNAISFWNDLFDTAAGFSLEVSSIPRSSNVIRCRLNTSLPNEESYKLTVSQSSIHIDARTPKGIFYAFQTLRQLLPSAIESDKLVTEKVKWNIPCVVIEDSPAFSYRGVMLDVSRHFIPKEDVKRHIDLLAFHKLNILHWHLTDDQGWRIEIKKYPKLTTVGGYRKKTIVGYMWDNPTEWYTKRYGGFYTQEDIKEMVSYAADRQIEIIPEIDMPAHSNAALAAYPQLACPVVDSYIGVIPGLGGSNSGVIYCAGNDSAFTFLQDVLDEVMAIFPSRYIHLGGDEAQKGYWKKCPLCQQRIKKEHLANEEDLQGYFMKRMSDYVRSKGREVIGWDELTNSSFLPEGVIIQGWRGLGTAALKAAEKGHQFIMTPARILYLIRYQGPQWFEPQTYFGNNTLKDIYDYEPVQADWKPEYASVLKGVQASMWTEFCNKPEDVDNLVFPRLAALAEVAWTQPARKEWTAFLKGLDAYNEHLTAKGIVYARSMYNIQHTVTPNNGMLEVELECIRPDMEIHYTTDGSEPTATSPLYEKIVPVKEALTLKGAIFAHGRQMGKTLILPVRWNLATAKPVLGTNPTEKLLTNGIRGSLKYSDFEWCSWADNDSVSFTIDLLKLEMLNTLILGCITNNGMAIHKPASVRVEVSDDNSKFREAVVQSFTSEEIFREGNFIENLSLKLGGTQARYVRVTAKGPGVCPASHVRPGQTSRIFFDEVMLE